jgi:hypothetical protein
MSQSLLIILAIALFRGVIWVVQKAQENAKARAAALNRSANPLSGLAPTGPAAVATSGQRKAPAALQRSPSRAQASGATQRGPASGPSARGAISAGRSASDRSGARRGDALRGVVRGGSSRTAQRGGAVAPKPVSPAGDLERRTASAPQAAALTSAELLRPNSDRRTEGFSAAATSLRRMLHSQGSLRQLWLAREVLGPPRSLRP